MNVGRSTWSVIYLICGWATNFSFLYFSEPLLVQESRNGQNICSLPISMVTTSTSGLFVCFFTRMVSKRDKKSWGQSWCVNDAQSSTVLIWSDIEITPSRHNGSSNPDEPCLAEMFHMDEPWHTILIVVLTAANFVPIACCFLLTATVRKIKETGHEIVLRCTFFVFNFLVWPYT